MSLSSDARPLIYHSNHQALSTARFCRAGQLATADTCRLYRYIACVVCLLRVCLLVTSQCCAKTDEPIKLLFEFAQETVHVFGGARITHGRGISGRKQYLGMPITISWPRSMFLTLFARGSSDAATAGQANLSLLSVSVISPHRRSQCQMRAIPTHVLTFRGLCFCVLVIAITAEPIEMPLGGQTRVGPRNHACPLDWCSQWRRLANTLDRSVPRRGCGLSLRLLWSVVVITSAQYKKYSRSVKSSVFLCVARR